MPLGAGHGVVDQMREERVETDLGGIAAEVEDDALGFLQAGQGFAEVVAINTVHVGVEDPRLDFMDLGRTRLGLPLAPRRPGRG